MTVRAETQIDLTRVDDGTPGTPGANGATFTPSVDAAGDISWTNDGGLPNPATQNIKGPQGVSLASVTNHYLATSLGSGVTKSTAGWTTTIQTMTSTNQYLWTYETLVGDDSSTISETNPVIIGRYGQNGTNGTNGVGISSIVEWYQISASNSTPPATPTQAGTGYSSTPISPTSAKPYLWNYEVISYTSGSPTITAARVIGTYGEKGDNGYTPYIQGGYWYINGTSTGVKAEGDDGTTSVWYYGNKITGTSTTPTVFSGSGIANAVVGDMYLNTDNSNVYQCTLGGNASTAKWVYAGTIADGIITVKSVNGSIASFADASEYPALEVITDINAKQAGSGTPSPSNPRAISGYTAINTFAAGKNLIDSTNATSGLCGYRAGDTVDTVVASTRYSHSELLDASNGLVVSARTNNVTYFNQILIEVFDSSGAWIRSFTMTALTDTTTTKTVSCPSNTYRWARVVYSSTSTSYPVGTSIQGDIQCELGSTATTYEPYKGNTYTTPLPSTVYGGTLDVTKGLLTVTHGIVDMGNLTWNWVSSGSYFTADVSGKANGNTNMISSAFKVVSTSAANMNDGEMKGNPNYYSIYLKWALYNGDKNALTSALTGQKLVYELATPQTYNVSPQQIQLLQGTNNVWTDSGDVDVKYAIISAGAVEALREPIDNASKVATSYITAIDDGGIKVHDASDMDDYAKIDSTGMQIYQNNAEVASFGANYIGIGKNSVGSSIGMCADAGEITAKRTGNINYFDIYSKGNQTYNYAHLAVGIKEYNSNDSSYVSLNGDQYFHGITIHAHGNTSWSEFGIAGNGHASFTTQNHTSNQAQIHVGSAASTSDVWMGIGAGGTNHGLYSEDESAWIAMSDGTYNYTGNSFGPYVTSSGSDGYYLGWSTKRWRGVYSYNAPNSVSDKKHKDIIGDIDFAKDLIMNLKPVEYQWKESDHKRTHMGLIAQDSAEVAKELGKDLSFYEAQYIDGSDYHGEETDDANLNWGMMYTELIAPLIKVVQEQQHEIDELKERIDALERK